jgi:hypothetical protein
MNENGKIVFIEIHLIHYRIRPYIICIGELSALPFAPKVLGEKT